MHTSCFIIMMCILCWTVKSAVGQYSCRVGYGATEVLCIIILKNLSLSIRSYHKNTYFVQTCPEVSCQSCCLRHSPPHCYGNCCHPPPPPDGLGRSQPAPAETCTCPVTQWSAFCNTSTEAAMARLTIATVMISPS